LLVDDARQGFAPFGASDLFRMSRPPATGQWLQG